MYLTQTSTRNLLEKRITPRHRRRPHPFTMTRRLGDFEGQGSARHCKLGKVLRCTRVVSTGLPRKRRPTLPARNQKSRTDSDGHLSKRTTAHRSWPTHRKEGNVPRSPYLGSRIESLNPSPNPMTLLRVVQSEDSS